MRMKNSRYSFDWFFSPETISKMIEIWLRRGTHHTQVGVGYVSEADKHSESTLISVTLVLACLFLLPMAPGALATSVATVTGAEGHP